MANGPCGRSSPLRLKRLGAEEDKSKRAEGSPWAVYSPASVWCSDVGRIFFFFFLMRMSALAKLLARCIEKKIMKIELKGRCYRYERALTTKFEAISFDTGGDDE